MREAVVVTKHKDGQGVMQQTPRKYRCDVAALGLGVMIGLFVAGVARAQTTAAVEAGNALYTQRCAHCHGESGDGKGVATEVVYPLPRDFTSGLYKFRTRHETTDGNKMPADEDIARSIREGLPGTSMPGWANVFTAQQIGQLVQYIKTFADVFQEDTPGAPINFGNEVASSPESIAKGKELFVKTFECHTCHGTSGRGNGPRALEGLEDDWGNRIWPANLMKPWTYRGGHGRRDIFRNIVMGITGTPMPAFADPDPFGLADITDAQEKKEVEAQARALREDFWHTVNYVQSLWTAPEEPQAKSVLVAKRLQGPLPTSPDAPEWQDVPVNYYPLVGQVVEDPRLFAPMIVGVEIQAVHNDKEIAFRLVWDDRTESKPGGEGEKQTYVDAIALQFPATPLQGSERPYFLMGDSAHPTDLWYWRNDPGTTVLVQTTGYKSFQPGEDQGGITSHGAMDQEGGGHYRVVMQRALKTHNPDKEMQFTVGAFQPFTVTAWDGDNGEQGGGKRTIMAWYNLYLEPEPSKAPIYLTVAGIVIGLALQFSALYATQKNHGAHGTQGQEQGRS
jgi:DMSO reductase family type II enzyme heme b subunit